MGSILPGSKKMKQLIITQAYHTLSGLYTFVLVAPTVQDALSYSSFSSSKIQHSHQLVHTAPVTTRQREPLLHLTQTIILLTLQLVDMTQSTKS